MGGDTRLITLTLYHNKTTTLQNLIKKILKTTSFDATSSFLIKYQLPTEDLDSLVSVSTDEDVQYMIEEYYYFNNLNSENSDGSLTNPLSRRNLPVTYQDAATQTQYSNNNNNGVTNDQNTRNQMQQQQIYDSAFLRSTSTAAVPTTTQTDLQHPQAHQQHQFILPLRLRTSMIQNTRIHLQQQIDDSAAVTIAVPPPQYIHHHPSGAVPMASYYPIYPPQSQHHVPVSALDHKNCVLHAGYIAPPNSQYRLLQLVPSSQHHQPQPQYVAYSHIQQPSQAVASSGGSGGNYAYEFADQSQQGHYSTSQLSLCQLNLCTVSNDELNFACRSEA
ncbi:putative PB1 domain-containing protein [Tanacetum coccineum]